MQPIIRPAVLGTAIAVVSVGAVSAHTYLHRAMKSLFWIVLTPTLLTSAAVRPATNSREATTMRSTSVPAAPTPGTYSLDPPHTFIYFAARHLVVGMVRGRFDRVGGTLVVAKNPADCSLDVTIDAASLSTQNTTRDADLRGSDFFDAAKFPTATYRGHGIRRSGDTWVINGVLTIRGVSKVVPLSFKFNGTAPTVARQPSRIAFQGTAAVKRADFNMTRDLLSEIGTQSAAPDVWLEINAEALAADKPKP